MYTLFFQKFNEIVPLTQEEQELIRSYLTPEKLRKKQYLLQEGDVCKFIAFVEKGILRSYTIDEKGAEHIIQFALEGWTISDLYSFLTGEPETYNIDAPEDAELVFTNQSAHEALLERLPKYETYIRLQLTGTCIAMQRRLTSIISLSLEERYTYFTELYPNIVQRVPQLSLTDNSGIRFSSSEKGQ